VFRPPYGATNPTTLELARSRRLSVWLWNDYSGDEEALGSGAQKWIDRIVSNVEAQGIKQQHDVVVMHNVYATPATVAALPIVIRFFLAHGYTFVDLLGRSGPPGTCGPASSGTSTVPSTTVASGTVLQPGDEVASPSDQFILAMRTDGNLELRVASGRTLWSSHTEGYPGASALVESTGDLVVQTPAGETLWSSDTSGNSGSALSVRDDGNVAVTSGGETLWSSSSTLTQLTAGERLAPGWRVSSPDGRCRLEQLSNGDLVLYDATGQVLWSSGTLETPQDVAVLEPLGNLEVRNPTGHVAWRSWTDGSGPTILSVANTGNLIISTTSGTTLWVTP
jgi:hypothetical protein